MNPYQYCTKCGGELCEANKETYQEQHEGGPVLCKDCLGEILYDVANPIVQIINEMAQNVAEVLDPFAEAMSGTVECENCGEQRYTFEACQHCGFVHWKDE